MFDLAGQVRTWQTERRQVWLARVVAVSGMSSRDHVDAAAFTEGQPPAGSLLGGAADAALRAAVSLALAEGARPRLLDLRIGEDEARAAGLACGGQASVLLQSAADLPEALWNLLESRTPVCLVTELDPPALGRTSWLTVGEHPAAACAEEATGAREGRALLGRGRSETAVVQVEDRRLLVTALWPTPRLLIVGDGLIAAALHAASSLLGWQPSTVTGASAAAIELGRLGPGDGVVVLSHDRAMDAPVLAAALSGDTGYVAALGSRRTQSARAEWLAAHGVPAEDIARVRGPAGLDIGARTPAEIALSIVAEMVVVRSGATGSPLAQQEGPIHHDGLHTPPARHPRSLAVP